MEQSGPKGLVNPARKPVFLALAQTSEMGLVLADIGISKKTNADPKLWRCGTQLATVLAYVGAISVLATNGDRTAPGDRTKPASTPRWNDMVKLFLCNNLCGSRRPSDLLRSKGRVRLPAQRRSDHTAPHSSMSPPPRRGGLRQRRHPSLRTDSLLELRPNRTFHDEANRAERLGESPCVRAQRGRRLQNEA